MILIFQDDHEHAPGANEYDDAQKFAKRHKIPVKNYTVAYNVMKDKLPEHVKNGVRSSVQDRLKKVLERSVEPTDVATKKVEMEKGVEKQNDDSVLEKLKTIAEQEKDEEKRNLLKSFLEDREIELASFEEKMKKVIALQAK